jgi:hypothetical protein
MEFPVPSFQWSISLNTILIAVAIVVSVWKVSRVAKAVIMPIRQFVSQFVSEHDVMWEDYNLRTGGTYRRAIGRGCPPNPEEFYQHHVSGTGEQQEP